MTVAAAMVVTLVIIVVAMRHSSTIDIIRRANEASAIYSLQEQIEVGLQTYRAEHGRYPDSLRAIMIDYSKTDLATPTHLERFYYRVTDDGYELSPPLRQAPRRRGEESAAAIRETSRRSE